MSDKIEKRCPRCVFTGCWLQFAVKKVEEEKKVNVNNEQLTMNKKIKIKTAITTGKRTNCVKN